MKNWNLIGAVIAIALLGVACSNNVKNGSDGGRDAGNAYGQVEGGGFGTDREAGQAGDAELDGEDLARDARQPDGRTGAETGSDSAAGTAEDGPGAISLSDANFPQPRLAQSSGADQVVGNVTVTRLQRTRKSG